MTKSPGFTHTTRYTAGFIIGLQYFGAVGRLKGHPACKRYCSDHSQEFTLVRPDLTGKIGQLNKRVRMYTIGQEL